MPKLKTNSGAKKRFRKTATGRLKFKKTSLRHRLYHESSKSKRHKRETGYVHETMEKNITKMLNG